MALVFPAIGFRVPRVPSSDPARLKGSATSHGFRKRNPWHPQGPARDQERAGHVATVSDRDGFRRALHLYLVLHPRVSQRDGSADGPAL